FYGLFDSKRVGAVAITPRTPVRLSYLFRLRFFNAMFWVEEWMLLRQLFSSQINHRNKSSMQNMASISYMLLAKL
ncbi:MAG: hypothetical protein AAFY57_01070, partial [Cyanobacteria bacterium J06642_2]